MRKEKLEELKQYVEELKTIKQVEINSEKSFLKSKTYDFTLANGKTIRREKLLKGKNDGSAAIIMPILQNDEILAVVEPRVFTSLGVGIGFPAGYIEEGEEAIKGAMRELREETGFVSDDITLIDSFYQDEGCSSALNRIYLAKNCKKMFNQDLDESEIIKYMVFNYNELLELEEMGYIMGGNTKLALVKTKKYFKK